MPSEESLARARGGRCDAGSENPGNNPKTKNEVGEHTMSKIKNWAVNKLVERQIAKEEGQGLAEYGLILALIAVACVLALTALGGSIAGLLNQLSGNI